MTNSLRHFFCFLDVCGDNEDKKDIEDNEHNKDTRDNEDDEENVNSDDYKNNEDNGIEKTPWILEFFGKWDTDYISGNWEQQSHHS